MAREWLGSHHRAATVNPAYQHALRVEPSAFCRGCHAPEADPSRATPQALRDLGVGCVTCHVPAEGVVLAAGTKTATESDGDTTSAHVIERSAAFASSGACAGCHEFRFDSPGSDDDGHMMQTTLREHARGPRSGTPCADCHMPPAPHRGTHRSHAFAEVRDPAFLRAHLDVSVERIDPTTLRFTLRQTAPAHAFPTGDLFRRLEIGGALDETTGRRLARRTRHLARHFVLDPRRRGRVLDRDDRVFEEPRSVDLVFDDPLKPTGPLKLSWWVTYQRVATVGEGRDPEKAKVESAVVLHTGHLAWDAPFQ